VFANIFDRAAFAAGNGWLGGIIRKGGASIQREAGRHCADIGNGIAASSL
jgi:hypothetical protein